MQHTDDKNFSALSLLPYDILFNIFSNLDVKDIMNVALTNKKYRSVITEIPDGQRFWRTHFRMMYPLQFHKIMNKKGINWFHAFKEEYQHGREVIDPKFVPMLQSLQSPNFDEKLIKTYIVKNSKDRGANTDSTIQGFTIKDFTVADLEGLMAQSHAIGVPFFLIKPIPQKNLDKLFNEVKEIYDKEKDTQHNLDLIFWAIALKQDLSKLETTKLDLDKVYHLSGSYKGYIIPATYTPLSLAITTGRLESIGAVLDLNKNLVGEMILAKNTYNTQQMNSIQFSIQRHRYDELEYLLQRLKEAEKLQSKTSSETQTQKKIDYHRELVACFKDLIDHPAEPSEFTTFCDRHLEELTSDEVNELFLFAIKTDEPLLVQVLIKKSDGKISKEMLEPGAILSYALECHADATYVDILQRYPVEEAKEPTQKKLKDFIQRMMVNTLLFYMKHYPKLAVMPLIDGKSIYQLLISNAYRTNATTYGDKAVNAKEWLHIQEQRGLMIANTVAEQLNLLKKDGFTDEQKRILKEDLLLAIKSRHDELAISILKLIEPNPELINKCVRDSIESGASKILGHILNNYDVDFHPKHSLPPLMSAAKIGDVKIIRLICHYDPDGVNALETKKYNALDYAIGYGKDAAVIELLRHGAYLSSHSTDFLSKVGTGAQDLLLLQQYLQKRELEGKSKHSLSFLGKELLPEKGIPKEVKIAAVKFLINYLLCETPIKKRQLLKDNADKLSSYKEALTEGRLYKQITRKIDLKFLDPISPLQSKPYNP